MPPTPQRFRLPGLLPVILPALLAGSLAAQDAAEPADFDIDALLDKMNLEEKVGQMTQLTLQAVSKAGGTPDDPEVHQIDPDKLREAIVERHIGSIMNCDAAALPAVRWRELITEIQDLATKEGKHSIPIIYGIDSIHGANFIREATLFPHNLGLAATRNPELVEQCFAVSARETRAAGITWNFAPGLAVGRQPLWSRFCETYGEDTLLTTVMGEYAVRGLQGMDLSAKDRVAATGRHFLGAGMPLSGRDQSPTWAPERYLREYFLPPFWNAIDQAQLRTVMVNPAETNGIPLHANHSILTLLLREQIGFGGVVVSDWAAIERLHTVHRVAPDMKEAVRLAIDAGIDIAMGPSDYQFTEHLIELVKEGIIPEARIDVSVRSILNLKADLGLFYEAYPPPDGMTAYGDEAAAALSLQAARESLVLLKNDGVLPLAEGTRILLTGPGCRSLPALHGPWSYTRQGADPAAYPADLKTVLQAFEDVQANNEITFVPGTGFDYVVDLDRAVRAAQRVDVIVCVLAENPGAGDLDNLALPSAQAELVKALSFGKPLIVVLLENRPRLITETDSFANAVLFASHPGPFGGQAIHEVLTGVVNPAGKLPFTYPRSPHALLTYDHKVSDTNDDEPFAPLYPFGHGLSYTSFAYKNLQLTNAELEAFDTLELSVDLANTGDRAGDEVVEVYIRDLYATITPPVKRLRAFRKIHLDPGQEETVTFSIPLTHLSFFDRKNRPVLEPGGFEVYVGDQSGGFTVK